MKINNILILSLLATVPLASCVDGNDWETDGSHNRLFGVNESDLKVETYDEDPTKATVTFTPYDKDTESYIIEVSTDSLSDDVPMGGDNAKVYGEDGSITETTVDISGLEVYTSYYLRVKAKSSAKPDSKWVYYNAGEGFKTPGILNDVDDADRLPQSIRLTWIAGSSVDKIAYSCSTKDEDGNEIVKSDTIYLSDSDVQAAEYTITGLTPNKTYTFVIYNGDKECGSVKAKTASEVPNADVVINLPDDIEYISSDMLQAYADSALAITGTGSATISLGIPAGITMTVGGFTESGDYAGLQIPDGASVTFFGCAGAKANLQFRQPMSVDGTHGFIAFEHVNIDGLYDEEANVDGCGDIINEGAACSIDSITVTECNVSNMLNSFIRMKTSGQHIGKIVVDNSIFNNHTGAYSLFSLKAGIDMTSINFKNSTFYDVVMEKNSLVEVSNCLTDIEFNVESCTFYNILGTGAYILNAKTAKGAVTGNFINSLFAKTCVSSGAKGQQGNKEDSGLPVLTIKTTNSYMTTDFVMSSGKISFTEWSGTASDIFKNPANADFTITATKLFREKVGDPRWLQ